MFSSVSPPAVTEGEEKGRDEEEDGQKDRVRTGRKGGG